LQHHPQRRLLQKRPDRKLIGADRGGPEKVVGTAVFSEIGEGGLTAKEEEGQKKHVN